MNTFHGIRFYHKDGTHTNILMMTKLHHGQYVHLDILANGNLRVTLTTEGVIACNELTAEQPQWDEDMILDELMNEQLGTSGMTANGGPLFLHAIDQLDGGNLSQAPCIVDEYRMNTDEEDDYVDDPCITHLTGDNSRVWYWGDYAIISILKHIKRQGEAELTLLQ